MEGFAGGPAARPGAGFGAPRRPPPSWAPPAAGPPGSSWPAAPASAPPPWPPASAAAPPTGSVAPGVMQQQHQQQQPRWPPGPPPSAPPPGVQAAAPPPSAIGMPPPGVPPPGAPPPSLRPSQQPPPPRFPGSGPSPGAMDGPFPGPPQQTPSMGVLVAGPQMQPPRPGGGPPVAGPPPQQAHPNGPVNFYGPPAGNQIAPGGPVAPPIPGARPAGPTTWQFRPPARVYPDPYGIPQSNPPAGLPPTQTLPPPPQPGMAHYPGAPLPALSQPGSPAGAPPGSNSRIDPNQIPRPQPAPGPQYFETRVNGQANVPPSATSSFIVRDTGNCSPRIMRCTLNQIPCSADLLANSGMPLALMVQPLALPHPAEDPIQVVDFGDVGPVRCSRCKGYVNPFFKFTDQGRKFVCNFCGAVNETPRDYICNLGPDGRRRDADERPELCKGTVEFVASKEYMVRDPMPPVFFFLVDVSMTAVQTGATAAACSAIHRALEDLPGGDRARVGVATFDTSIHFYNLNKLLQQPAMLVVPDVQDVYTPLHTDLIVPVVDCRGHLEQLLENLPSMFQDNPIPDSAFGAAIKGAYLALKSTGGKLLVFQSVLPSVGLGALTAREVEGRVGSTGNEKEAHKLLLPADKVLKTMAIEFAEFQVCVDLFMTTQRYVDVASLAVVPRTTGGQIYYYNQFNANVDSAKLYNDLRWNLTRPQGLEAVMRVRCSQGLQVQEYVGNFSRRTMTDVDLPAIDCDKTIMVTFKHDEKLQEDSECCFQCALLYTTLSGERRIRVSTLSLPASAVLVNLFRGADLDAQFTYFLKSAANDVTSIPLLQVKDKVAEECVSILYTYRKYCASQSSSGQLILPEALKLLPLYTLALTKSMGLRSDIRIDERSYWLSRVALLSASLAVPLVYPRMFAIHDLAAKEEGGQVLPTPLPLSSDNLDHDSILLLENGEDAFILVAKAASRDTLQQLFGIQSVDEITSGQFLLQQYDNEASKRLNEVVNEIRRQRCSYLRLRLIKRGDPLEMLFFSLLVEDKSQEISYVEFLVRVHKQIQVKMKP